MKYEINRNRAFVENTENNMEVIEQSVDEMVREDVNPHPHDFISVNGANTYPEEVHDALELPGKFEGIGSPYAYTTDVKDKYLDYLEIVTPDGKVVKKSANNVEFQFNEMPDSKKRVVYDYKNSTIMRLQMPTRNFVAINFQPKDLIENYEINEDVIRIVYIVFDEDQIYKNLNSTKDKYNTMNTLLGGDFMLWVQSIAFLDENCATDFLEESVDFFTTIENVNNSYFLFLHLAHKVMIKYYVEEENKQRRLLGMITKAVPEMQIQNAVGLEKVYITNEQLRTRIIDLESENADLKTKNSDLGSENADLKTKNSDLGSENADLKTKNRGLETKTSDLESENADLKIQLNQLHKEISELKKKNSN